MKLAIMQPYLFPYLGYYQLMSSVDKFIIYDDVSYIKNGWINRNRILVNGNAHYFTVPVIGGVVIIKLILSKLTRQKKRLSIKSLLQLNKPIKNPFFSMKSFRSFMVCYLKSMISYPIWQLRHYYQ